MKRFVCTPSGAVLAGRRKLKVFLLGLTFLMLAVAVATWIETRRFWLGLIALLAALVPAVTWRLGSNVDVLWLEVGKGQLVVRMRWRIERYDLGEGTTARRLTPDEIRHVQTLASTGGVITGNAGFESHFLGEVNLYASDLDNAVLVKIDEGLKLVVTPDDVEGFVGAMGRPVASSRQA